VPKLFSLTQRYTPRLFTLTMSRKLAEGPLPAQQQARGARLPAAPRPLRQHKPLKQAQPAQPAQPGQPDKPAPPPKPLYPEYAWQNIHANTELIYCRNAEAADAEIAKLPPGPLGFDLEWKPIFKRGVTPNRVALVQLANESTILLLQVSAMSSEGQDAIVIVAFELGVMSVFV
jgi:hypothetical protein